VNILVRQFARMLCGSTLAVLVSCTSVPPDDSNIFIRVDNSSEKYFKEVSIGRRIIKQDSYSNTNYITQFKKLDSGSTSTYKSVKGKHLGLSRIRILNPDNDVIPVRLIADNDGKSLQEVIARNGGIESAIEHPYSKEILKGHVLADGKYTFLFNNSENGVLLIIRED